MNCPYCGSHSVSERTVVSKEVYWSGAYYCIACDKDFTNDIAIELSQSGRLPLELDEFEDEDLFEWPSESQPESDREFLLKDEVVSLLREVDCLNLKLETEDRKILSLEADFDDFRRRIQMRSALSVQDFLSSKMPSLPDYIERKPEAEREENREVQDLQNLPDPIDKLQPNYTSTNIKA
jgi:DNA-directed RNA polymerase subunit RPC12/RpoP